MDRNQILVKFIMSLTGAEETNSKKLLCVANSIDSIYKARNLSLITPLCFSNNILSYCASGSRFICDIYNSVSPAGSYTSVRKWLNSQSCEPPPPVPNADTITFFDNSQVIGRNWRVCYNYKSKASVITTVLHIVPSCDRQLQKCVNLSPTQWLYVSHQQNQRRIQRGA